MPKKIKHKIVDKIECKICSKCKQWKGLRCFFGDKNSWDSLYHKCKLCCKEYNLGRAEKIKQYNKKYHKQHYIKHPLKIIKYKIIYGVKYKRCSRCKKFQLFEMFHKNETIKDGLSDWCKPCRKKRC
jgi:hypothetical protein